LVYDGADTVVQCVSELRQDFSEASLTSALHTRARYA
jgi:hypothetical protein